jgi:hypothetical protein
MLLARHGHLKSGSEIFAQNREKKQLSQAGEKVSQALIKINAYFIDAAR